MSLFVSLGRIQFQRIWVWIQSGDIHNEHWFTLKCNEKTKKDIDAGNDPFLYEQIVDSWMLFIFFMILILAYKFGFKSVSVESAPHFKTLWGYSIQALAQVYDSCQAFEILWKNF